ncbi:putative glucan 1,3-beta-glucosidase D [Grifola frondosa]|uniref:glucan 1,3-beta-glucosidase n=1 Tax=Grifola frondosa TaxID=5627 RepID=A0A1C7MGX5_GRIFR|nr:putative glucan 1,3-beta-glucosidase D [Grifola frondosa]
MTVAELEALDALEAVALVTESDHGEVRQVGKRPREWLPTVIYSCRLLHASSMPQPSYNPVPSNTYRYADDRPSDRRPLSPGAQNSHFFESETDPLAQDGYPRPRFMGPAADDAVEEYSSSVYALNDGSQKDSFYNFNYHDDPHDADFNASEQTIGAPKAHMRGSPYLEEKRGVYASPSRSRRKAIIIGCIVAFIAIAVAVVVAVYFAIVKPNSNKSSVSGAAASGAAAPSSTASSGKGSTSGSLAVVTGGDGSTVTMDDGSTFTYQNSFGGYSWTPALNETFNYGVDPIRGVNLGGWLVTEPFIVPALYEKYVNTSTPAVDEWTLSEAMAADTASGGLQQLEDHYNTFITEKDFAAIAAAGLNFVRIPIPYWAIEVRENEPFLPKVAWTYFLKAIE